MTSQNVQNTFFKENARCKYVANLVACHHDDQKRKVKFSILDSPQTSNPAKTFAQGNGAIVAADRPCR